MRNLFVLDTLGKLRMHGHGIGGYCLICQRLFSVSMTALIAERGADTCSFVQLRSMEFGRKATPCDPQVDSRESNINPTDANKWPAS